MKAVVIEQGSIVPTFEAHPVAFQRIRESDSFLTVDIEYNGFGTRKLRLVSGRFEGHLRDQAE